MSDEEKKAIEYIKNCLDDEYDFKNATRQKDKEGYNIILNLIEKQSKEIEELKKNNETQPDCVEPVEKTEEMVNMRWVNHKYISKDKILELLGIEDKKVQIEYNNVFNKGVKSVVDKIKAKIEELEKEKNIPKEIDFKAFYRIKDLKNIEIKVLESILEKE